MADTGKTIGLIKALASVDPEAIKSSVDDWLDDHPEATTTVEDGAITKAKLDSSLQQTVDDVGDLKSACDYLTEAIELVQSQNLADPLDTEPGAISDNGTYNTASGYYRTKGYISILPNTEYYSKYPTFICYYDSGKNFISRISTTNTGAVKTTPQNAYYAKLIAQANPATYHWRYNKGSLLIDEDYFAPYYKLSGEVNIDSILDNTLSQLHKAADAKVTGDAIGVINNAVDNIPNTPISLSMIQSIGIIGDSFASGYIVVNGSGSDYYPLSWGKILGRDIGATTVDNYSKAGEDTKSWLTDKTYGLNKLNSSTPNQLYIIALGINDAARNKELGTIADIESDSIESFYSWYGRIVRAIQNHAPNAIIMLSTNARFGTGYNRFSDAIKAIGTYYSFPVLDLSTNSYFNSQLFTNAQVGEHPIAIGYAGMAKAYKVMIEQALSDNYTSYMTFVGQ